MPRIGAFPKLDPLISHPGPRPACRTKSVCSRTAVKHMIQYLYLLNYLILRPSL